MSTLAIWITGSSSGTGKIPLRPQHSISKLSVRMGAMPIHSPSGACATTSPHATSASIWHVDALDLCSRRSSYLPLRSETHPAPTMPASTMYRMTKFTFDSYVRKVHLPILGRSMPPSSTCLAT